MAIFGVIQATKVYQNIFAYLILKDRASQPSFSLSLSLFPLPLSFSISSIDHVKARNYFK